MEERFQIKYLDEPAWDIIRGGLRNFYMQQAGPEIGKNLCYALYPPDQTIVGGVIGETRWSWLHIISLCIKDDLCGHGFGHSLLTMVEEEARQRGAKNS